MRVQFAAPSTPSSFNACKKLVWPCLTAHQSARLVNSPTENRLFKSSLERRKEADCSTQGITFSRSRDIDQLAHTSIEFRAISFNYSTFHCNHLQSSQWLRPMKSPATLPVPPTNTLPRDR